MTTLCRVDLETNAYLNAQARAEAREEKLIKSPYYKQMKESCINEKVEEIYEEGIDALNNWEILELNSKEFLESFKNKDWAAFGKCLHEEIVRQATKHVEDCYTTEEIMGWE